MESFDLAVVGGGIVGLAHALAGVRRGLRVAVIERHARAISASVRNFGFVTVSGQESGDTLRRARRSVEIWREVAADAGIPILQRGALIVARRPEAFAVLEEFAAAHGDCALWDAARVRKNLRVQGDIAGALSSPHELRIEARDALPKLASWLAQRHGVEFFWGNEALSLEGTTVRHANGTLQAGAVVIAPGLDVATFAPQLARQREVRCCTLQMMRIAAPGFRLPAVVMSDLSVARYGGFSALPSAARLRERLERECGEELAHGVHVIVAQGEDGSLVVGDSHHYAEDADPFHSAAVEALILRELRAFLDLPQVNVLERWLGHYPVANVKPLIREALAPRVRLVTVTNGLGMSTAFAIGEETLAELPG